MEQRYITALLIEDNPGDVVLIKRLVAKATSARVRLEAATRLGEGLERIDRGGIDVVLLDLSLPDSAGVDTVRRARAHAPDLPIIVPRVQGFIDNPEYTLILDVGGDDSGSRALARYRTATLAV